MCVFVSLTGLNNRSPKAQATCGHHGPANIKSLIISHYHFNGIPTTFCGWLMHLTTLIAHNSKIQKKIEWIPFVSSVQIPDHTWQWISKVISKDVHWNTVMEHTRSGSHNVHFLVLNTKPISMSPLFFCLGDGKAAYTAVAKRVPYIGIAFTPDHAPWLKKVSH